MLTSAEEEELDNVGVTVTGCGCRHGCVKAFYVLVGFGLLGVLVDVDHLVCLALGLGTLDPQAGEWGCRLWHSYLLPVGGACLCAAGALGIGLLVYVAYSTARAAITARPRRH